jgi:cytochrome P450
VPPGALTPGDGVRGDQRRVLDAMTTHGPVLKVVTDNVITTFVAGLGRGRRLLTEHDGALKGLTVDLTPLFPRGALRGMEGEDHKTYRRLLREALKSVPLETQSENVDAAIGETLAAFAAAPGEQGLNGPLIRAGLRAGAGRIMMGLLYGVEPPRPEYARMRDAFRQFGPREPVYELAEENSQAFRALQEEVRTLAALVRQDPASARPSMLRHLVVRDQLDDTALGNLVNLFEPSHFDVFSLWHWLLWYLAREPGHRARIRAMPAGAPETRALLDATVRETLRLDQSETLLRVATRDLTFEGFLIPRQSRVRVCLWESHKDPATFPDPFRFDPDRFLAQSHSIEEFAPFGLDRKRCIGGDLVLSVSARFVERMAREYDWEITGDGPPFRGVYHWQPSPQFTLRATRST